MDITLVLTVTLAAAFIVVVLVLVAVISFVNLKKTMKMYLVTLAAFFCCWMTTAVAQSLPAVSWRYSDRCLHLPPLRVDFDYALFPHSQPSWLQVPLNIEKEDTVRPQSIMFRQKGQIPTMQYHYKSQPDYSKMVDNFGDLRDRIVRKRRQDEGRPLQPLPPRMRRR